MNKRQRAKNESYIRVLDTVKKYPNELKDVDGLQDEVKELTDCYVKIGGAGVVQQTQPFGTEASQAAAKKMGATLYKYVQRAYVKAKKAKDLELKGQLDEPETYYTNGPKTDLVNRAKATRNVLNDNLKLFTNIKATDIALIDADINAYELIKDDAQEVTISVKASGTDVLKGLFEQADDVVENILMLADSYIGDVFPAVVGELELASALIIPGAKHNEIDFLIVADEDDSHLPFAELKDPSTGKNYRPGVNHHLFIPTHRVGHFDFEISAPGRVGVSFGADIKKGENSFVVRLKKS